MKKIIKNILVVLLVFGMLISSCPTAFAVAFRPNVEFKSENCVTFSNLSQLAPYESIQYAIKDHNGNPATVGIEAIPQNTMRAGGLTHRVWYSSIFISAEFYMDVSNNQVTSVYDESIDIWRGSYKNKTLTHTSSWGKLTFETDSTFGYVSGNCWLRGTVTNSDNEITVDWKM